MASQYSVRHAVALIVLAWLAPACDDPTSTASAGDGGLTGSVALAKTGEGVGNAVIALTRDGVVRATTATAADGSFTFRDLADGRYTAHLVGTELTGLSPLHTVFEPRAQPVTIGSETPPLLFAAVGIVPARVTGVVRCGGEVLPGARVRIVGGMTDTTVVASSVGRYALLDMTPGHYVVLPQEPACLAALDPVVVHVAEGQYVAVDLDA